MFKILLFLQISTKYKDLKKLLCVTYVGENELFNNYDTNGRTKEWLLALIKEIFSPELGLPKLKYLIKSE